MLLASLASLCLAPFVQTGLPSLTSLGRWWLFPFRSFLCFPAWFCICVSNPLDTGSRLYSWHPPVCAFRCFKSLCLMAYLAPSPSVLFGASASTF